MDVGHWDKGQSYYFLKNRLLEMFEQYRQLVRVNKRYISCYIYTTIALIQLCNGLRAGEAVNALYEWLKNGKQKFKIVTEKSRTLRPVIIPRELLGHFEEIKINWGYLLTKNNDLTKIKKNYISWLRRKLVNTHTLRYAFIRKLVDEKVPGDQIALILGHSKVDTTFHYEKRYEAEKRFEDLVYSGKL